jgi:hypothetical protein
MQPRLGLPWRRVKNTPPRNFVVEILAMLLVIASLIQLKRIRLKSKLRPLRPALVGLLVLVAVLNTLAG